jgi:ABC-type multidrug transport system ATPase subunit
MSEERHFYRSETSEEVIRTEGLTKIFNSNLVAVDHVNFDVKRGEIFGFLGPNGAGKTTTINMLITILKPTEGKASVLGFDIAKQDNDVSCTGFRVMLQKSVHWIY